MLEQICAYIHNYFISENGQFYGRYAGEYTITGNTLELPFMLTGQYFMISGSRLNDGVHQYPADDLNNETFQGAIYEMRPPRAFLDLVSEISDWQTKYSAATEGPYQSESFNGYSYSKSTLTDASGKSVPVTWQTTFEPQLKQYRKLSQEVLSE